MFKGFKFSDPNQNVRKGDIDKAFNIMNKCNNKNIKTGYLGPAEIQQAIDQRISNLDYSIDECAALIAPADTDGDGRLSLTEFEDAMLM
jgi:Ca2+-binding EF-hand superfamily protein